VKETDPVKQLRPESRGVAAERISDDEVLVSATRGELAALAGALPWCAWKSGRRPLTDGTRERAAYRRSWLP
jgi:hypothetical protein